MFAVIKTGGKQYRVVKDDVISVEKLKAEAGDSVSLDEVLMIGGDKATTMGTPLVQGASVSATVLDQARADKIIVFKKKRRQNYRRKAGHRQDLTILNPRKTSFFTFQGYWIFLSKSKRFDKVSISVIGQKYSPSSKCIFSSEMAALFKN